MRTTNSIAMGTSGGSKKKVHQGGFVSTARSDSEPELVFESVVGIGGMKSFDCDLIF